MLLRARKSMASADHLPVLEAVTSLKMDEAVFFVMVKVIVSLTPVVAVADV